jgi:isopentenyl diphosphate isomerase/L-lactate dehydrogenase-like FMN-dependent dehydrogenase
VSELLDLIAADMRVTMTLIGADRPGAITRDSLAGLPPSVQGRSEALWGGG